MSILKSITAVLLMCCVFCMDVQAQSSLNPSTPTGDDDNVFRTQTIGGWGARPRGNNPGTYLHTNFEAAFPTGLTIGDGANTLTFTTAGAITAFLPSSGGLGVLDMSYTDPTKKDIRSTLISQAVALTISTTFDKYDAAFGESKYTLESLVIAEGDLANVSIKELLVEANKLIGGLDSEYTASQINSALSGANEAYVDGQVRTDYLKISTKSTALQTEQQAVKTLEFAR